MSKHTSKSKGGPSTSHSKEYDEEDEDDEDDEDMTLEMRVEQLKRFSNFFSDKE